MADTTWDIDGITANGLIGSQPALTLGESATYSFRFSPDPGLTDHLTRVSNIKAYQRHAGAAAVWKTIDGDVRFKEQQSGTPDLVVKIEPAAGTVSTQAIWGLVMGLDIQEDSTPQEKVVVNLDVIYLGDLSEYATEADLRNSLETA